MFEFIVEIFILIVFFCNILCIIIIGGNYSGHTDAVWNQKSVLRVAKEIKKLCSNNEVSTPDSASLLDVRSLFYSILINNTVLINSSTVKI